MSGPALALALLGCADEPLPLGAVEVASARLEKLDLAGMAVFGGGGGGTADLVVGSVDGDEYAVPVSVSYGSAGLLIDMTFGVAGTVELGLPPHPVRGDELFGTYKGSRESLVLLVGAVGHHLENEAGVRIDETSFALGVSLFLGVEWLHVSPDLPETEDDLPTGDTGRPPPTPTGDTAPPAATGATGDTG